MLFGVTGWYIGLRIRRPLVKSSYLFTGSVIDFENRGINESFYR